jgi:hypothetical protein
MLLAGVFGIPVLSGDAGDASFAFLGQGSSLVDGSGSARFLELGESGSGVAFATGAGLGERFEDCVCSSLLSEGHPFVPFAGASLDMAGLWLVLVE